MVRLLDDAGGIETDAEMNAAVTLFDFLQRLQKGCIAIARFLETEALSQRSGESISAESSRHSGEL